MANIGKNIKQLRTMQNMTQDQLAEALHVTRQTVSNYETGKSQPDIDMIVRLSEILQTEPNTLIYGIPVPPERKREYAKMAVIAGSALVLVILAIATKRIADEMYNNYVAWMHVHRTLYLLPLTYLMLGYAAMQGLSLWAGLKPIACWWGKVLLIAAVAFYLFLAIDVWYIQANSGWWGVIYDKIASPVIFGFTWDATPIFLLPGAGLWLLRIKKKK